MFKRVTNGKFEYKEEGFLHKKRIWRFRTGNLYLRDWMEENDYNLLLTRQQHTPTAIMTDSASKKRWWMFKGEFYCEDDGYSETEVAALVLDRIAQKAKKVQRAVARLGQDGLATSAVRQPIPDDVRILVWKRDGGRCVKCGSQKNLEYDHIIPLSKGGSNTARNLQLLCEVCNRSKGANLV